jgi:hypothetical protein
MKTLTNVAYLATAVFCLCFLATDLSAQSASGQNPLMLLNRNNSGLPNGTTAPVVPGDTLGDIRFQGLVTGVGYRPGATIQSYVSGPVGPNFVTASMLFRTGTPRPVMRMTIRENGFIGVNTFTPQQLLTLSHATRPVSGSTVPMAANWTMSCMPATAAPSSSAAAATAQKAH